MRCQTAKRQVLLQRVGRQLRPAAQAGPETGRLGRRGGTEKDAG